MVATKQDVKIEQGGAFEFTVDIRRNGEPVDNIIDVQMQIRPYRLSDEVYYTASSPAQITIFNGASQIQVVIPDSDTEDFDWYDGGEYDVEITLATGRRYRVAEGRVSLSPEVTRS